MRGKHNVLNAKMHKQEAQIVEEAGKPVWLPLQLIWRSGTDIKLRRSKAAGGLLL
jgi:preprotein translocase subunit SecA